MAQKKKQSKQTLQNHILTIGSQKYSLGFFWQVTSFSGTRRIRAEAERFSQKLPAAHNFLCIKTKGVAQYGIGADINGYAGHTNRAFSAAETVFQNINPGSSFIAVWQLGKKYWLCMIRAGVIYPNGDRLFDDAESARSTLEQNVLNDQWDQIIAPKDWNIKDSTHASLKDFLEENGKARLLPLKQPAWIPLAAAGIVILFVGGGLYSIFAPEPPPPTPVYKPVAKKKVLINEPAWKFLPKNTSVHRECMKNIKDFYRSFVTIPGWRGTNVTCDVRRRTIIAKWRRDTGTANVFYRYARVRFPGEEPVFTSGGQGASITRKWDFKDDKVGQSRPSLSRREIEIRLWSLRQSTRINLQVSRGEIDNQIIIPPKGIVVTKNQGILFTVSTNLTPDKIFIPLYKIAGSVIYSIRFEYQSNRWTMEGFINETGPGKALLGLQPIRS